MWRAYAWGCVILSLIVGCTSYEGPFVSKSEAELDAMEATNEQASRHFYNQAYAKAEALLSTIDHEQTVSSPQYLLERASLLLMQGQHTEAHQLMMQAREQIETLFDPASEEKAVSFWHGENNKVFKGDYHERATLYALLALSFIEKGEWEDAQRCVKNGLLADIPTEANNYRSDYALLHYLGYFVAKKQQDSGAAEDYKREFISAMQARGFPAEDASASYATLFDEATEPNALLVVWTGVAPSYMRGGEYEELRMVVRGSNPYTTMTVALNDGDERTLAKGIGDINFQATTRGGREMDNVLANKAALKKGMEVSRNIFMAMAAGCFIAATQQNDPNTMLLCAGIGTGCFAVGVVPWVIGACINSTADVRYWHNLPGEFLVMPLHLPEGEHRIALRAYSQYDNFAYERITLSAKADALTVRHVPFVQDRLYQLGTTTSYVTALRFFELFQLGTGYNTERLLKHESSWMQHELK